ncbi:DNA mismatch repair protein msh6 [Cladochytrium replicatum]|nr:DNA mismatch repair protein msh6 [Cladochytrium replicatum]
MSQRSITSFFSVVPGSASSQPKTNGGSSASSTPDVSRTSSQLKTPTFQRSTSNAPSSAGTPSSINNGRTPSSIDLPKKRPVDAEKDDSHVTPLKRIRTVSEDIDDEEENIVKTPSVRSRKRVLEDDESDIENRSVGSDSVRSTSSRPVTPTSSVGPRTPVSESIKHLAFNTKSAEKKVLQKYYITSSHKIYCRYQAQASVTKKQKNDERYGWLVDVRDAEGRRPSDPEYDVRTLLVPQSAWKSFTDFERQFWEIKSQHWDTVVFFKKGKFYELYENDADIGHQQFDLKLTDRVNMKMVGVPEKSFEYWAAQFIAKGHKVAKVDQMETAVGKSLRERKDKGSGTEKVIRRQLTSVLTAGTLIDSSLLTQDMHTYCMAVKESDMSESSGPTFGICFVDTSTAEFSLCQFVDDAERTQFETLLLQLKPKELVLEKSRISTKTNRIIKNSLERPQVNHLKPELEFWDAEKTKQEILFSRAFTGGDGEADGDTMMKNETESWPQALREMESKELALSAFGGLMFYLRSLKIDKDLLSAKNFEIYDPIRHSTSLILDGQTLVNLEIFENSVDNSDTGTLFKLLNQCQSPMGKRMLKGWVCHPLRSAVAISDRLNAIDDLNDIVGVQMSLQTTLRSLPDLERSIARIHGGTCKVKEFVAALSAFEKLVELYESVEPYIKEFHSRRLAQICQEGIPDVLRKQLEFFKTAFDHNEAVQNDAIAPHPQHDEDYDNAQGEVDRIEKQFEQHRVEQSQKLGVRLSEISYKDMGKELFQLELPAKVKVPKDWTVMSQTQKVYRYWNPFISPLVTEMAEAKEIRDEALRNIKSNFFKKFDENFPEWLKVVRNVAELDCFICLAQTKSCFGAPVCRPEFVLNGPPVLELEEARHPCLVQSAGSDFIPNDTAIGGEDGRNIILLTGPNMGGKSTLLRQTCIAVILAQIGCYVPAQKCRLSAFDRIFTRIGANDSILSGQSTFMVELSETSKILSEATPRSLVILDELGRGTSTFDGYAIAYAVLHYLTIHVGCLGLFSTHYSLTEEFTNMRLVRCMYMSFLADGDQKEVTFLYKLIDGVSPSSFGMNVASLAGVPMDIVQRAESVAKNFERSQDAKKAGGQRGVSSSLIQWASFSRLIHALINDSTNANSRKNAAVVEMVWRSLQAPPNV